MWLLQDAWPRVSSANSRILTSGCFRYWRSDCSVILCILVKKSFCLPLLFWSGVYKLSCPPDFILCLCPFLAYFCPFSLIFLAHMPYPGMCKPCGDWTLTDAGLRQYLWKWKTWTFSLFLYFFSYVCCMCVCALVHVCTHVWKPEAKLRCCSSNVICWVIASGYDDLTQLYWAISPWQ